MDLFVTRAAVLARAVETTPMIARRLRDKREGAIVSSNLASGMMKV
jgi:hypothetical protein